MVPTDEALLDSPAYASLCGAHARLAQVRRRVRRYPADVAPFLAVPLPPSAQGWRAAEGLVAPGTFVAGQFGGAELPDGWRAVQAFDVVQMIEDRVAGVDCAEAIPLGAADVREMLELVAQTEPGPVSEPNDRAWRLPGHPPRRGTRRDAGERFHPDGWTEISAVCTTPDHRAQGLASGLIGALIAGIQRRSERAFLHVMTTNTGAIRLYDALGSRQREHATLTVVTREPAPHAQV